MHHESVAVIDALEQEVLVVLNQLAIGVGIRLSLDFPVNK